VYARGINRTLTAPPGLDVEVFDDGTISGVSDVDLRAVADANKVSPRLMATLWYGAIVKYGGFGLDVVRMEPRLSSEHRALLARCHLEVAKISGADDKLVEAARAEFCAAAEAARGTGTVVLTKFCGALEKRADTDASSGDDSDNSESGDDKDSSPVLKTAKKAVADEDESLEEAGEADEEKDDDDDDDDNETAAAAAAKADEAETADASAGSKTAEKAVADENGATSEADDDDDDEDEDEDEEAGEGDTAAAAKAALAMAAAAKAAEKAKAAQATQEADEPAPQAQPRKKKASASPAAPPLKKRAPPAAAEKAPARTRRPASRYEDKD
jgi:hypothetical protein